MVSVFLLLGLRLDVAVVLVEHGLLKLVLLRPHGRGQRIERRLEVWLVEQRLDRDENGSHVVERCPLFLIVEEGLKIRTRKARR